MLKKKKDLAKPQDATDPKQTKKEKKKKPVVIKSCLDIIPIRAYDERMEAFLLVDGSYLDILRIVPRDLNNIDDDELNMEIGNLMKIYKTVSCDLKFISMKFPLNLNRQKEILQHHKEHISNEAEELWLDRQHHELELAERNVSTLNFYLIFTGKNGNEFIKNKESIAKYSGVGTQRLTEEISSFQKVRVLEKLANMNTQVDLSDEGRA